jgi:O-antigen ligase
MLYGLFMKFKAEAAKRNKIIGLTLLHLVALLLTFSRGAWGGAFVAMVACVFFVGREKFRLTKRVLVIVAGIAVLLGGSLYMLRDQRTVQNIIQHSDETTVAAKDSNALHLDFVAQALKDIADKPQGHGPGTAGIVSIRNPNGGQLTENYYVQLLYEVGVVGFAVFAYAVVYVMRKLKGTTSLLGASLFAAAIAYACMGMLMHIWSNETVAAQWWLLAGAAIGLGVPVRNTGRQRVHK